MTLSPGPLETMSPGPRSSSLVGVGLGFRLGLARELLAAQTSHASFLEVAPENYLGVGGDRARLLAEAAERWPLSVHGLCGDLSGAAPLDAALLEELRSFLRRFDAPWYSDHLCFTHAAGAELHDLLPLPFTGEAVMRAAARIREVQERLELPVAVENVSAYLRLPGGELDEAQFVAEVVREADCSLLLDINNVYVNSVNFGFDPRAYIERLPLDRVVELHMAGHHVEREGLLVDTHGAAIVPPVYALLSFALSRFEVTPPILLERDNHLPPLEELEQELARLASIVEERRHAG